MEHPYVLYYRLAKNVITSRNCRTFLLNYWAEIFLHVMCQRESVPIVCISKLAALIEKTSLAIHPSFCQKCILFWGLYSFLPVQDHDRLMECIPAVFGRSSVHHKSNSFQRETAFTFLHFYFYFLLQLTNSIYNYPLLLSSSSQQDNTGLPQPSPNMYTY